MGFWPRSVDSKAGGCHVAYVFGVVPDKVLPKLFAAPTAATPPPQALNHAEGRTCPVPLMLSEDPWCLHGNRIRSSQREPSVVYLRGAEVALARTDRPPPQTSQALNKSDSEFPQPLPPAPGLTKPSCPPASDTEHSPLSEL